MRLDDIEMHIKKREKFTKNSTEVLKKKKNKNQKNRKGKTEKTRRQMTKI